MIGGCDGAEPGRNYFSDYAQATPPDSFILTLGCGKFRIRDYDYGELLGLPRLLDMGQCNDAYGAIKVAVGAGRGLRLHRQRPAPDAGRLLVRAEGGGGAADAALPGRQGDHASGPNPPGFVTPNVFKVLQDKFDLRLTGQNAQADLALALA